MFFPERNERDQNMFRATVSRGVVNRFLCDPIKVDCGEMLTLGRRAFGPEATLDAVEKLRLIRQILKRTCQAALLELHGTESTGQCAGLRNRLARQTRDEVCVFDFIRGDLFQAVS